MNRHIAIALLAVMLAPMSVRADTLIIVGVAVDKTGQRMSGALVRLYATSNPVKAPLAEDRTSERGIFSLYRTNIAGDIGNLFIVYEGEQDKVAEPLKVTLKPISEGLIQSRTSDLVILQLPQNATLTSDEAAERIAAVAQTQAVLVEAGAAETTTAERVVAARSTEIMAKVAVGQPGTTKFTIDRAIGTPPHGIDKVLLADLAKVASAAAIVKQ